MPKTLANKFIITLGPEAKIQTQNVMIHTGKLSTDNIVEHLRNYKLVKEDILQLVKQYGLERQPMLQLSELSNLDQLLDKIKEQLSETKMQLQQTKSTLEKLQLETDRVRGQASKIDQLSTTGFQYEDVSQPISGFKRILGRLPNKKLQIAEKMLQQSQTIVARGKADKDSTYLLIAVPSELSTQIMQTLSQYGFSQVELPEISVKNAREELASIMKRADELKSQTAHTIEKNNMIRKESMLTLNELVDKTEDVTMLLRASLRLGDGTNAAYLLARFSLGFQPDNLELFSREVVYDQEIIA